MQEILTTQIQRDEANTQRIVVYLQTQEDMVIDLLDSYNFSIIEH